MFALIYLAQKPKNTDIGLYCVAHSVCVEQYYGPPTLCMTKV